MDLWTSNEWLELANIAFTLLGIVVSAGVAYWIVIAIQKRISDDQAFKSYLATNLQQIKNTYRDAFIEINNKKSRAKDIQRILGAQERIIREYMLLVNTKYPEIAESYFDRWMIEIRKYIENLEGFNASYKSGNLMKLEQNEYDYISKFDTNFVKMVNKFIVMIYEQ